MTKEQLEKTKQCLEDYSILTHETSGGRTIHDCCLGRVIYENGRMTDRGHMEDCVVVECLKIVNDEINRLEDQETKEFMERLNSLK